VEYRYDSDGNVTAVVPPGRTPHTFSYSLLDQEQAYIPPDLDLDPSTPAEGTTHVAYDLDRNVDFVTRADGTVIDYAYDDAGRLERLCLTGCLPGGSSERHVTYGTTGPQAGKLLQITSASGTAMSFDWDGPLLTTATLFGDITGTLGLTYNDHLQVDTETVGGSSIAYAYDLDGLILHAGDLTVNRSLPASGQIGTTGRVVSSTLGATLETWTYDPYGALASLTSSYAGTAGFVEAITGRDALGRITDRTEAVRDGSGTTTTKTYHYGYDEADRLAAVTIDGTLASSYTYDTNGVRLTYTGARGTEETMCTDSTPAIDAQDRVLCYGGAEYTYNENGELVAKNRGTETTTYAYDVFGQLGLVHLPDGRSIEYVLDPLGRRVGKKVTAPGGASTVQRGFLYVDGLRIGAELNSDSSLKSRFVYGTGRSVPDYMMKDGVTYRLVADHLGSVRAVIRVADGVVVQQLAYDEFGNVLIDTAPGFQPFGFAGGLYDADTGLLHFGAREYDAALGRWTSKDPLRFRGGDVNIYAYVWNDPINVNDPSGLGGDVLQGTIDWWEEIEGSPCHPGVKLGATLVVVGVAVGTFLVNVLGQSEAEECVAEIPMDIYVSPWTPPWMDCAVRRLSRDRCIGRFNEDDGWCYEQFGEPQRNEAELQHCQAEADECRKKCLRKGRFECDPFRWGNYRPKYQ
jgi:RHS repeat-associated protein